MKKLNYAIALATLSLATFSTHAQEDGQQMLTQGVDSGSGQQYALRVLAPLDGTSSIGGRMMLDESMGVDIDLTFNLDTDTKTTELDDNLSLEDVLNAEAENSRKGLELGLEGGLINYISKGRVSPYYKVGGGLKILTSDKGKGVDNDFYLLGGLGAEFFIIPEFSLFAEAGLQIPIAPDFAIHTGTTQVGLAYYF